MNSWRARLGTLLSVKSEWPQDNGAAERALASEPVLIVDDDRDWAEECAFNLRSLGYEPLIACNPDEAVDLFMARAVNIAIVDYNMPGCDGITLCHELTQAAEAQGRQLRFIMATGCATKEVAIDAMRASAVDFLEKPVGQDELRKALQRIKGLSDKPAAREVLLNTMSSLRLELQRLSQLIDDSGDPARDIAGRQDVHLTQPAHADSARQAHAAGLATPALADYIRGLLKKETKRRNIGGGEVFGDPAWEMLLDLMLAKIEMRRVSVSSACIASGAPMSTALRLVGRLVDEGVLRKIPDETDRRRHFLAINPRFEVPLLEYLSEQLEIPQ